MVALVSPIEPASAALASAIGDLRKAKGLTQEAVAHGAGLTPGSLSRIERAQTNPTWTTVERLARALGVTMGELCAAVEHAR